MSQHIFSTTTQDGIEVTVQAGWDKPLDGYYLVVERDDGLGGSEEEGDEGYLFTNLSLPPAETHPKSFNPFIEVLLRLGVQIPNEMLSEILRDGAMKIGNRRVTWNQSGEGE